MTSVLACTTLTDDQIRECARVLDQGGIIALPTETVYGLVSRADSPAALRRLYEIKQRPQGKPFALFVSGWNDVYPALVRENATAQLLARRFWPGPLTLVTESRSGCPASYDGTVGLRCPDHPVVQRLLSACGGLLVNTSLNLSQQPPARMLHEARTVVQQVDIALDAGGLPDNLPSTVVDCRTTPPRLLRVGGLSESVVRSVLQPSESGP